jgi:hypothetical protein
MEQIQYPSAEEIERPRPRTEGHRHKANRLAKENELLLRNVDRFQNIEEWERMMPQDLRDAFAARALIEANGSGARAACVLGFSKPKHGFPKGFMDRLFDTAGVQAILKRDLSKPEEYKSKLIERMVQLALYADEGSSIRAMQLLSKLCGWIRMPEVLVQNNRQTILALVTQKDHRGMTAENLELAPSFLDHEPCIAVRIDSGEHVALALKGDDDE